MSVSFPLKEKAEVRAATCSPLMRERSLRSSSERPSEKYSCALSPLMLTNGSTAMEWGGGAKAAGAAGENVALDVARGSAGFEVHGLLINTYARGARASTATPTGRARRNFESARVGSGIGDEPEAALAGDLAVVGGSGDSRRLIRATNSGGASPPGNPVHCT